jgi:EcoRII C terminal/Restriction endonuclease EcoRII, N-terminal
MVSPDCERAIDLALARGNALLKFISPNDAGVTGSHQSGFLLPKKPWEIFTPHPPEKGTFAETKVAVTWPNGLITDSRVKWYGQKTRSEYRLTRFGRDFPYLTADTVGDLLVVIPESHERFDAFIFDHDDDIEELQAALGIEPFERWGVYREGFAQVETEDECLDRNFRKFVAELDGFPKGEVFSRAAREFVQQCVAKAAAQTWDDALVRWMTAEYQLFRMAERQICQPDISRTFRDVDDFLETAARVMNRRKSRAGRSLENHVDEVLTSAAIPHDMRPDLDGRPDVLIPGRAEYLDQSYPVEKLCVVGVKTTCKDRWRQVLNEAKRVPTKHILTMQPGISTNQLAEMNAAGVTLIVPAKLQKEYPRDRPITMLTVEEFVADLRRKIS